MPVKGIEHSWEEYCNHLVIIIVVVIVMIMAKSKR